MLKTIYSIKKAKTSNSQANKVNKFVLFCMLCHGNSYN